jgi:PAS domain S-box-containing protein
MKRQMGFAEVDPKERDGRQVVEPHGEAVSANADVSLFAEELFDLQYIMRAFVGTALPVLTLFVVYNFREGRLMEAVLVCSMGILLLLSYLSMRKYRDKSLAPEKLYRIYQNVVRGFLLIFLMYISYAAGWKSELDRVQWSYIFPIVAFFCLGRREGSFWAVFFLASMVLILFYPRPEALSLDASVGFKLRYLMSFSVMCAIGFAGKYGREVVHARLVYRQGQLAESEKKYREAYEGLHREMEERQQAQKALVESEAKYRNILENIEEGYHEVNLTGNFTFFNDSFQRITGYSREELMGMNYKRFGADEENARKIFQAYNRVYRTGEPSTRIEWDITRKDGVRRSHETSASLIKDSSGNPQGFRGIVTDITDRKHAEEEKRSMQERLQRAEKMEALGTMAGGVAHDLNNVLGIVVGYAEMLLMDADKSSSIRPNVVNIMTGGQRAAAIVQDLLTLARRGVSGREVLNLNKIIADCQQSPEFERLSSYHSCVQIKTDLEPDLPNISGSPVHLSKTLFNLVSNASEAMPKDGIVTIKTANQYLNKPIQGYDEVREGDYVVLSVSDTGEGISATDLKRIFEPFYTKKIMGRSGTGLGLAVVWGTVKDHNGYIDVQSEEGKGSTFTLYFPASRQDISAEAAAIPISEYVGKGESILVVDDVKGQRDLAAGMLRKLNYSVSSVSSGEGAVAYLKEHQADLMVLDMIMDPGMDGLDTYRSILEIHPTQKAIIVSGFSETDRVITAQALGAGAYVRKPYVIEKLGLAVRNELDRK